MQDYRKYKWFYTSSGKLVVGGKSSTQNDELLSKLKKTKKDYIAMHTVSPGSPFSIILAEKSDVTEKDLNEAAIFTGCFSRQWREHKSKAEIDIFSLSQIYKSKTMKSGTWGVKNKIKKTTVNLELVLTIQDKVLRAVPEITPKKKDILLKIKPGKLDKQEMLPKFQVVLSQHFSQEELLQALPSGGVSIVKN
jgi:hypothetical protein